MKVSISHCRDIRDRIYLTEELTDSDQSESKSNPRIELKKKIARLSS